MKKIAAGVPQSIVLGSALFLLYTNDIPYCGEAKIATFADDTAILTTGKITAEAKLKLQIVIDNIVE